MPQGYFHRGHQSALSSQSATERGLAARLPCAIGYGYEMLLRARDWAPLTVSKTVAYPDSDASRRQGGVSDLPPLEALRFFEAAARHGSFSAAAREVDVTPATVSYHVNSLERHIGTQLFTRFARGVSLNAEGQVYLNDIRRVFAELRHATARQRLRRQGCLLKLVSLEVVAEKWLMPKLADFKRSHPDIAIEFDVDHGDVDPRRRDFDIWIACPDQVPDTLQSETLLEETLFPVCSPQLIEMRGRPREPSDLHHWPLVYDLHWTMDWSHWFAHHGVDEADLSGASGFRLYTMVVQAAVDGIGVALGHSLMIARELEQGTLVTLLDSPVAAPGPYLLVTATGSRTKPEVVAFKQWILGHATGSNLA